VPAVVELATEELVGLRKQRVAMEVSGRARKESRRVERWEAASLERVAAKRRALEERQTKVPRHIEQRLRKEEESVKRTHENHMQLLKSLSVDPNSDPFIRLVAVFAGS